MLKLIVCIDKYNSIGIDNNLIYKYKKDLEIFKQKTINHTIIMGRKTFESIGSKPLVKRENIVISKTLPLPKDNSYTVFRNIKDVLKLPKDKTIYIIGGKEIYEYFYPYYDELHITIIKDHFTKNYNLNNSLKININLNNFKIISSHNFDEFHINIYKRLT